MLEVALRNSIHRVLSPVAGDTWFDLPEYQLNARQLEMLSKARHDLDEAHKDHSPGSVVAALTFGFWTAMLGREYENLWQETLHNIGHRVDGKGLTRKAFAAPLVPIRILRNRIAHHEPILYWDLRKHHSAAVELTGWLSPAAANWCRDCSRFDAIYPGDGISLNRQD